MQIFKNKTNIDFIGKRRPALFISTVLNLAILVGIATRGFNYGVDFAGGTVVEIKYNQSLGDKGDETVRKLAEGGGLHDVKVQQIGPPEDNTYLLKLGGMTQLTPENAEKAKVAVEQLGGVQSFRADLDNGLINVRTDKKLPTETLKAAVESTGTGVKEVVVEKAVGAAAEGDAGPFDYRLTASGMADAVVKALTKEEGKQDFHVQRLDYVGPQVGKQLRNRGVMALLYAMLAILVYVAFRFDFKFGPGALVAMVHDTVMVAGYYMVTGTEFNLTSIAVLLTIIGYSINDTIVIYDRIREEMYRFKGKPFSEIINIAINETLGRTLLTSGVTALSLLGLLIFGVGEIFDFAAAMLVGIVVGTYSTIYIASPLTIWLDERAAAKERTGKTGGMKAKVA